MDLDLTPWVRLFNENVPRVAISIVTATSRAFSALASMVWGIGFFRVQRMSVCPHNKGTPATGRLRGESRRGKYLLGV